MLSLLFFHNYLLQLEKKQLHAFSGIAIERESSQYAILVVLTNILPFPPEFETLRGGTQRRAIPQPNSNTIFLNAPLLTLNQQDRLTRESSLAASRLIAHL